MPHEDDPATERWLMTCAIQELVGRAGAARRAGRLEEAEALYRLWLKHDPRNPYARYGLSDILLTMGNYEEGFALYEARLELPELDILGPFSRPAEG